MGDLKGSMESTSGSGSGPPLLATPTPALAEVDRLIAYLKRVWASTFWEEELPARSTALSSALYKSIHVIQKFTAHPQSMSLFIQNISNQDDDEEDEFTITLEVCFRSVRAKGIILTKRGCHIESGKSIPSQIRVVVLNDETLHSYLSTALAVAAYFKPYHHHEPGRSADTESDKLASSVKKKMAELEMSLLCLQQNIDIPEISLHIHPVVAQIVSFCAQENRRPRVVDFGDRVDDSSFLNDLQQGVNCWVKEIQKVTKLDRDPSSGTTLQEVSFWLNLERSLLKLQEKRESLEVELTLEVLRHGKRFHSTVSFENNIGLNETLATVNDYSRLMKSFPIHDLLAARDLEKTRFALERILVHLRKIRSTKYPIERALRLVEAISRDLSAQLLKILGTRKLMVVPFEEFERVMGSCFEIFNTWDEEFEKLHALLRDIMKKRPDEMKMIWRVSPAHRKLQMRMEHIHTLRRKHEQLRSVIERVLRPDQQTMVQGNATEEVSNAYALVEEVEVLEISKEGQESWDAAVRRYNERVDTVEARITAALRGKLATAKSGNEMSRIFARFNALFVRPQIRGGIREYQTQFIQRVKDDIETLHEKFKTQYSLSKSCRMSEFRDIPPVSGSIIWAKQIDRQLTTYLRRVEAVLGSRWENHVDGQRLKSDVDSFRIKLNNVQPIFEEWVAKVQQKNATVSGRIFDIEHGRSRSGIRNQFLGLKVNFLPELVTLAKEIRHLKNLGFRVPLAIMNKGHQATQMHPYAISLMESVSTYERSWEKVKIEDKASVTLRVARIRQEVHQLLSQGMMSEIFWESYMLESYVNKLSEVVSKFAEKVDEVLSVEMDQRPGSC